MRRQSWTLLREVMLCPAVTYWLLGLSVIRPALEAAVSSFPLAENPQPRRQTCWEHLLVSLPLFPFLLPSLHSSLATSLLNLSLPFLSSTSTFPSPHTSTPSPPFGSTPPYLHPCFLASLLCPITGGTTVELCQNSLRCWFTLHTVMCHLCIAQCAVRMTLLGCMYRQKTSFLSPLFLLEIDISTVPDIPTIPHTWTTKYCRWFVIAFQKNSILIYQLYVLRFVGDVRSGFEVAWNNNFKKRHLKKSIFWSFFPQKVHYAPHFKGMIRNMSSYLNDWTGRLSMTKWLWQVMLCPAVACWLLGLSVIWLAWQQLCPMSQNGIWVWESISDWHTGPSGSCG